MSLDSEEILVSADSHVTELPSLWEGVVDPSFWGKSSALKEKRGTDPMARGDEMKADGVVAEVLYPTLGLKVFSIEDVEQHEAACKVYNRWLIDYCGYDSHRLVGIAMIPCYRPEVAIEELRFCHAAGMRGAMVWQTPHPDLPFTSFHYDPIWAVAQGLDMPINVHILTGFNYSSRASFQAGGGQVASSDEDLRLRRMSHYHGSVNEKLEATADTLFAFLFGGVLERFPGLKLVIVENEAAWLPFYLNQWDYYYRRFLDVDPTEMTKPPSEYFDEQVLLTFFRDPWVGRLLPTWGQRNLMWSNDFPHGNSTWPKSREFVNGQLAGVSTEIRDSVLRQNCIDLYKLPQDLVGASS